MSSPSPQSLVLQQQEGSEATVDTFVAGPRLMDVLCPEEQPMLSTSPDGASSGVGAGGPSTPHSSSHASKPQDPDANSQPPQLGQATGTSFSMDVSYEDEDDFNPLVGPLYINGQRISNITPPHPYSAAASASVTGADGTTPAATEIEESVYIGEYDDDEPVLDDAIADVQRLIAELVGRHDAFKTTSSNPLLAGEPATADPTRYSRPSDQHVRRPHDSEDELDDLQNAPSSPTCTAPIETPSGAQSQVYAIRTDQSPVLSGVQGGTRHELQDWIATLRNVETRLLRLRSTRAFLPHKFNRNVGRALADQRQAASHDAQARAVTDWLGQSLLGLHEMPEDMASVGLGADENESSAQPPLDDSNDVDLQNMLREDGVCDNRESYAAEQTPRSKSVGVDSSRARLERDTKEHPETPGAPLRTATVTGGEVSSSPTPPAGPEGKEASFPINAPNSTPVKPLSSPAIDDAAVTCSLPAKGPEPQVDIPVPALLMHRSANDPPEPRTEPIHVYVPELPMKPQHALSGAQTGSSHQDGHAKPNLFTPGFHSISSNEGGLQGLKTRSTGFPSTESSTRTLRSATVHPNAPPASASPQLHVVTAVTPRVIFSRPSSPGPRLSLSGHVTQSPLSITGVPHPSHAHHSGSPMRRELGSRTGSQSGANSFSIAAQATPEDDHFIEPLSANRHLPPSATEYFEEKALELSAYEQLKQESNVMSRSLLSTRREEGQTTPTDQPNESQSTLSPVRRILQANLIDSTTPDRPQASDQATQHQQVNVQQMPQDHSTPSYSGTSVQSADPKRPKRYSLKSLAGSAPYFSLNSASQLVCPTCRNAEVSGSCMCRTALDPLPLQAIRNSAGTKLGPDADRKTIATVEETSTSLRPVDDFLRILYDPPRMRGSLSKGDDPTTATITEALTSTPTATSALSSQPTLTQNLHVVVTDRPLLIPPLVRLPELAHFWPGVDQWDFDIFELHRATCGHALAVLMMYIAEKHDFFNQLNIPVDKYINLVRKLEQGYHNNPYHNSLHAADVLQNVYALYLAGNSTSMPTKPVQPSSIDSQNQPLSQCTCSCHGHQRKISAQFPPINTGAASQASDARSANTPIHTPAQSSHGLNTTPTPVAIPAPALTPLPRSRRFSISIPAATPPSYAMPSVTHAATTTNQGAVAGGKFPPMRGAGRPTFGTCTMCTCGLQYSGTPQNTEVGASSQVLPSLASCLLPIDLLYLVLSAAAHDLGHVGVTNQYLVDSLHPLALAYNDQAVQEHYHSASFFSILRDPSCNVFERFSRSEFSEARQFIVDAILATDMKKHLSMVSNIQTLHETKINKRTWFSPQVRADRLALLELILHSSDVANPSKIWKYAFKWAEAIRDEWFRQADLEKRAGLPVTPMMEPSTFKLAKSQIGFIDYIVSPLFAALAQIAPLGAVCVQNIEQNRLLWKEYEAEETAVTTALNASTNAVNP